MAVRLLHSRVTLQAQVRPEFFDIRLEVRLVTYVVLREIAMALRLLHGCLIQALVRLEFVNVRPEVRLFIQVVLAVFHVVDIIVDGTYNCDQRPLTCRRLRRPLSDYFTDGHWWSARLWRCRTLTSTHAIISVVKYFNAE